MALPEIALQRGTVTVADGSTIEVRGLSRAEVLKMADFEGKQLEGEAQAIAWATGLPLPEVRAWYASAPFPVVQTIIEEIGRLSGTGDGAARPTSEA